MIPSLEFSASEQSNRTLEPETLARATKLFHASGCLQLAGVFSATLMQSLREAYATRYESYFREERFEDAKSVGPRRWQTAVELSGAFNSPQLYANPLILPILHGLLGSNLFLGIFGAVTSLPGAEIQHRHRDNPLLFSELINRFLPPYAINLFVPLIEFNEITGTTRLFPGTHLKGNDEGSASTGVDPVIPVGSCLLMDYRLYHQGTPNRSKDIRPMLFSAYHRPWFKDYRNHQAWPFLRLSETEYARIPAEHRAMFSWVDHYRTGLY